MGTYGTKYLAILLCSALLLLTTCDQGLAPPVHPPEPIDFPVEPEGGNPTGLWVPDEVDPVTLVILDPTAIPVIVDSLAIETSLEGIFRFDIARSCSIHAFLNLIPSAYVLGSSEPITVTISDTLIGSGPFEINEDRALDIPLESRHFELDTLGFTVSGDRMDLITLPNIFNYLDIVEIPVYFVFHLTRTTGFHLEANVFRRRMGKNR